jgi:hypothetical protein
MKIRTHYVSLIVVLATGIASAQVATGTPPFGSFGGGPFDTVNLGNLNVHFAIPMLNKAGRGMSFTYNLSYDGSVWTPVVSNGTTSWNPVNNWGWRGVTEVATGYISSSVLGSITTCEKTVDHQILIETGSLTTFSYFAYHDAFGVVHPFKGSAYLLTGNCGSEVDNLSNSVATDGSGYTLNFTVTTVSATITSRGGKVIDPPFQAASGVGTVTDANGNQINVNGSGQFFDTLSSTTPVLTVSSAAPPTATTFTYTAPSGASTAYTMNYLQYTVQTGFGFSGISEYGPLSNSLVSSIQLPDGSSYTFTYEKTPDSCTPLSGTYSTNCVTGRIVSVTLPTGGTITYSYTGGTNSTGIYSDGSTAGLNRTLSPGGQCDVTGKICTKGNERESTWRKSRSCPSRGTSQSKL